MSRRWFDLSIDPAVLRTMTREQVYAARRWLRLVARRVHEKLGGAP